MNKRKQWLSARDSRSVRPCYVTECKLTSLAFAPLLQATSPAIALPKAPAEDPDPMIPVPVVPYLLFGETAQGFMTVEYREGRDTQDAYKGISMTSMRLGTYLCVYLFPNGFMLSLITRLFRVNRASDRLCLSEQLDEEAVRILLNSGLEKRFQQECRQWKHESTAVHTMSQVSVKMEIGNARTRLQKELPALRRPMFEAILDEVSRLYP